jgi:8-oxo-dGTP diphosphatase
VYVGTGHGSLAAADDAADARVYALDALPAVIAFDHRLILEDYRRWKQAGIRPPPRPRRLPPA